MANWKNEITVEVRLPYITQGCTLDYLKAEITVYSDSIWFTGEYWKAIVRYGDYPVLLYGKATRNAKTTYRVQAFNSHDGYSKGAEQYKVKVISFN